MPHKDPAQRAAYNREYRARHLAELNAYGAAWKRARYANDPTYNAQVKATARAVPAKVHAAHMRVYKAIKRGELVRPDLCSQCGRSGFIEAAHLNYDERLAVIWLCRSCHRAWDHAQPKR